MNNIIKINNLTFRYKNKPIFKNFNLNIKEGEWISIVGPNGSGKSTLVKILVGLMAAEGDITIDKLKLNKENLIHIRKKIGVVFENANDAFVAETVADDIAFTLENLAYEPSEIDKMIKEIASIFKISHLLDKEPYQLSGGEKQKVAIAAAMVAKPRILIIDDALEMVDDESKREIFKSIKKLHRDKTLTIITVTHSLEETYHADRMVVINNGQILIDGPVKEVLQEDRIFYRSGMEIPFMIDLSIKLRLYGLIDHTIIDMDEMVNALWK